MAVVLDSLSPVALTMGVFLVATALARKDNAAIRFGLIAFSLLLLWRYLWWRATQTLSGADWSIDYVFGTAFFVVELLVALNATTMWIVLTRTSSRSRSADRGASWVAQSAPLVDVLICTYNEEREILERTINGAKAIHYRNYRLWVLDDGRRPWLEELCAEKACMYLARHDGAHAKAGNINHALRHIAQLQDRPDFIAVLDADFVPFPQFLNRVLALCADNSIGLVQTPQHFFNPDPIQSNLAIGRVFPDEQRFFFDALMPAKDAWGQAFCCGTSCVIRFSALEKIEFFPTSSVTEDFLLSARLAQHGYRTVYLNERLSVGLGLLSSYLVFISSEGRRKRPWPTPGRCFWLNSSWVSGSVTGESSR
jgi:cellulose synthase (UDP-forming)